MKICLEGAGKRYGRHWVFRNFSASFSAPEKIALLGNNGSGKSTLLRTMAGMQLPSAGKVFYEAQEQKVPDSDRFQHISFCAPGMELPEEMTLAELLEFHFTFKKPLEGFNIDRIIGETGLANARDQLIGDYSSGMRQRVKLAQAVFSDTPVLLLDEPCTNLDEGGVQQYQGWIGRYAKNRLTIVASNDVREYEFCERTIRMSDFA